MDQPRINHGSTWINVDQSPSACRLQHIAAVMAHASCVMRQAHVSCVMRQTHGSWLMRQTSDSWLMAHGSCVRRPTSHVHSVTAAPFSDRRPLPVMTTTGTAAFSPCATLSDLRLLSCTAWGNRVVLPPPYSSMGAIVRIKTGRGAQRSAAACCYSYEKGRHNAGPGHGD